MLEGKEMEKGDSKKVWLDLYLRVFQILDLMEDAVPTKPVRLMNKTDTMGLVLFPFTIVDKTIFCLVFPYAMLKAKSPFALIHVAIMSFTPSLPMPQIVFPRPRIDIAVREFEGSLTIHLSPEPLAFVVGAVLIRILALAMRLPILPRTVVTGSPRPAFVIDSIEACDRRSDLDECVLSGADLFLCHVEPPADVNKRLFLHWHMAHWIKGLYF